MARIIPRASDRGPSASWSIGKEVVGSDRIHRGWFIDHGLDQAFDEAAEALGWAGGALSHMDGNTRPHWFIPMPCRLHVLILGVPFMNIGVLARNDIAYAGLGCRWTSGDTSRLGALVIHPDLVNAGYEEPFPTIHHHIARTAADLPTRRGITYVWAGNGLFKHAWNGRTRALVEVGPWHTPGLGQLRPFIVWRGWPHPLPSGPLNAALADAITRYTPEAPKERQWFIVMRGGAGRRCWSRRSRTRAACACRM